jgi:midasin
LDHRGQVYVPELDQTFSRHPGFVVFAAQNPHSQGGGRKGLPASFVNRFTVVYADILTATDLIEICTMLYPNLQSGVIGMAIQYVTELNSLTQHSHAVAVDGSPWEFNLRDTLRWLRLLADRDRLMSVGSLVDYQDVLFLQRFRGQKDVSAVTNKVHLPADRNAFRNYFHNVSPKTYQCGLALLSRNSVNLNPVRAASVPKVDLHILESVMICVQQNWPCLLIGPSGSGKTNIIHHISSIVGADIAELTLNADTDTMDLVGGYEQVDMQRRVSDFAKRVRSLAKRASAKSLLSSVMTESLLSLLELPTTITSSNLPDVHDFLSQIKDGNFPEFGFLSRQCSSLIVDSSRDNRARFEWVDGTLINALETGQWLILDNANLCSSAVLDRLNSLLEPNGILAVNEHRSADGTVKVVKPHPQFRLFLTMDPRHGDLSRAMRNRCIELFVHGSNFPFQKELTRVSYESSIFRFSTFQNINWDSMDNISFRAMAFVCLDHLSIYDFDRCNAWYQQAVNGLVFMRPEQLQLLGEILEIHAELASEEGGIISRLLQYYEKASSNASLGIDYCKAQVSRLSRNRIIL